MNWLPKLKGFTLIEMMLGLGIGAIVISGAIVMFVAYNRSNLNNINTARLDHELRSIVRLVSNDLRRAGYWSNSSSMIGTNTNSNPFMQPGTTDVTINGTNDCVLLTYDVNNDGSLPALNAAGSDERFGYRLSGTVMQSRPLTHTTLSCDDAADEWENLSNPNLVEITSFSITPTAPGVLSIDMDGSGSGTSTISVRNYSISITGRLANDTTVTRTLSTQVRVRNDLYTP